MTVYRFSFNTKVLIVRPTLFLNFVIVLWLVSFDSSKCTCLSNLISILILILAWLPRKNLSSLPRPSILRDLQNQEYRLQFRCPGHGWQKNKSKQRQLQNLMRFTQTQERTLFLYLTYCFDHVFTFCFYSHILSL